VLEVGPEQALAFRVAGHHLHRRTDPRTAVAAIGIQEAPPGWGPVAVHARATAQPAAEDVVLVNAMRGAPHWVLHEDLAIFTTALVPHDAGLARLVGSQVAKELSEAGVAVPEAVRQVSDAARDALAAGPLDRDAFHQALRERLPEALLPWCRGCRSHHVRPGLWRALGPLGVTVMPARATYALAPDAGADPAAAGAELVRRFLRCFGPATHTDLAAWAQTAPAHAKALFGGVGDELEPVRVDGRRGLLLAEDASRLETPPAARGVRLLGGHDPLVGGPHRELLAPDAQVRKRMFPAVGRPGVVLRDGRLAGLWRSRKVKERLEVELDWVAEPADVACEAQAVARLRGCAELVLR